jgi:hypothetical protein
MIVMFYLMLLASEIFCSGSCPHQEDGFISVSYSFDADDYIEMTFSLNYVNLNFLTFLLIFHEEASIFFWSYIYHRIMHFS